MRAADLPPIDLSEFMVAQCLDLLDELRKGAPSQRRHATTVEAMREIVSTTPSLLPALFSAGAPNLQVQAMVVDAKVESLFFSALFHSSF